MDTNDTASDTEECELKFKIDIAKLSEERTIEAKEYSKEWEYY